MICWYLPSAQWILALFWFFLICALLSTLFWVTFEVFWSEQHFLEASCVITSNWLEFKAQTNKLKLSCCLISWYTLFSHALPFFVAMINFPLFYSHFNKRNFSLIKFFAATASKYFLCITLLSRVATSPFILAVTTLCVMFSKSFPCLLQTR